MAPHCRTPTRSRIKGVFEFYDFCQKNGLTNTPSYRKVKRWIGRSLDTIHRILQSDNNRRLPKIETRSVPGLLSEEQKDVIEALIQDNSYEGHDQKLDSLRHECELPEYSNRTIMRALKERDIRFYIAASEEEIGESLAS